VPNFYVAGRVAPSLHAAQNLATNWGSIAG
jgi:hypothetical protein